MGNIFWSGSKKCVQGLPESYRPQASTFILSGDLSSQKAHSEPRAMNPKIVRAQKKVSKGRPKTPPKSCSVVRDPQV
jgi:hypothetical protein